MNPGFTFSTGVSVSGPFLHTQAGSQSSKQTHIPYSQQRPSGPSPSPCGGTVSQGQPSQAQPPSQQNLQQSVQLQVHGLNQQQSPTKLGGQAPIGKSPPHHPGLQQVGSCPEQTDNYMLNKV